MNRNFILAKARNLCYYYSIDTRPRSTYIHIVRKLREEMKNYLNTLPKDSPDYEYFLTLVRECPQKIKAEECGDYIMNVLRPRFYGEREA